MADNKKNQKAVTEALGKLPLPVPGSSAGILETVRKAITDAMGKSKKPKEKK